MEAALSFAVETLGNFLIEKAVFLKGVAGEVEWLRNELKRMQCFQKDAEKKMAESESESIRRWVDEIREVAHDAADAVEMFVLYVEGREQPRRRCGGRTACFPTDCLRHRSKVGEEIESIRRRLKDIEESRVRYGIRDLNDHQQRADSRSSQAELRRRVAYWQKDGDVVGLEEDVEEIVSKLLQISVSEEERRVRYERKRDMKRRMEEERKHQEKKKNEIMERGKKEVEKVEAEILAILKEEEAISGEEEEEAAISGEEEPREWHAVVAVVGIGKSTLARIVYNHPAMADRFERRAWVVVSREFKLEDVMKQIMRQISSDGAKVVETMENQQMRQEALQKRIYEELRRKLYFIVLDDLWEVEHWELLKRAFPKDPASVLMLTSRNQVMTKYNNDTVGKEIESIHKRLKDIKESRMRYGIQDLDDMVGLEEDGDMVGLEEHVEELVSKLLQISVSEKERRVRYERKRLEKKKKEIKERGKNEVEEVEAALLAILMKEEAISWEEEEAREWHAVAAVVGMGGIGKSTLASTVYNHPAVADRFERRAWVVVSREFKLEDVMKQIMHQLGISLDDAKVVETMENQPTRQETLQKRVYEELRRKLYFIVLDDLWEVEHWELLKNAFPKDPASRLMLTSRNQVMTKYSDDTVHVMKLLDAKRSLKLLLRKASIDNNGKCPEELKDIAEEILKKCDGLPLAISVVGGLLLRKEPHKSEWQKVLNEMKSHLDRSNRGDIDTISAILELSYSNLLPELKACFLCLAFFKEDAVIKAKHLVHIWVAHGLVPQEVVGGEETMEDVGREYLNELISRNMVQEKESRHDQVTACHMHDLLRDISLRKAKEEMDFEVVREEISSYSYQSLYEPRHRAIYNRQLSVLNSTRNQHVRSVFIHGETECNGDGSDGGGPQSYWKSFELLRVLDLGHARFQVWPKEIGRLIGLRYLKMVYYGVESDLPHSWSKLKNLQVLSLGCGFELFISDRVILEMDSLRHLYAYITTTQSKVPLGKMRNLRTLCWFVVDDSNLWQVTRMTGISKLGIDMRRLSDASQLFKYLSELEKLVNLTLIYHAPENFDGLQTLDHVTQLKLVTTSLPRNFPPNLSHLTLSRIRTTRDPMSVLEKLPKLLYLKLRDAYMGDDMLISRGGFPCLKVLCLQDNVRVKNIVIEEGTMPELKQLIIHNCKRLIIDNLPKHLKSKIVVIDN